MGVGTEDGRRPGETEKKKAFHRGKEDRGEETGD